MQQLTTDVLVVGGGAGGTAAALQAARRGAKTFLVSEFDWLGGMLTTAGVCAPDGNELLALQTGLWGAFLQELRQRHPEGLDHAWVSFFTYHPQVGAQIFADWVKQLPNLHWIAGQSPQAVLVEDNRVVGVRFADVTITAKVTLDATELGDLLPLMEADTGTSLYRWGWELQAEWGEPSAPATVTELTQRYPVQAPTWVVILQDFGVGATAPEIPPPPNYQPDLYAGAWTGYGADSFLNYGRLPANRFMINWPQRGNDYGEGVQRLVESPAAKAEFFQESLWHTQGFAHFIQTNLGRRYGLAPGMFPHTLGEGAYALHPYYRESRRLRGITTVTELDILPIAGGQVAALPRNAAGDMSAIAYGNYANDHHYPNVPFPLAPKSLRWGGRWTGTPFTIPYGAIIPAEIDGLLVCEKNISVSHIANGATRLQPVVLGIAQAAGMAAALCVEQSCQPRELSVRSLQSALLQDPTAPAAVVPLFNLPPHHPDWLKWQQHYCDRPEEYPVDGHCPMPADVQVLTTTEPVFRGLLITQNPQEYKIQLTAPADLAGQHFSLVTLDAGINQQLQTLATNQPVQVRGNLNQAGNWLLVSSLQLTETDHIEND